uniref:RNase H type-1 domain-containing protein n=1 Tax=Opuntia streptacantha TaxID=393608 RepID=A0A7C9AZ33_OPUST
MRATRGGTSRCHSCKYFHPIFSYSEDFLLFTLIMCVFSFIPYNPSLVTKEGDENGRGIKPGMLAVGIAIISSCFGWVFVSQLVVVLRPSIALHHVDDGEKGGNFYTLSFDGCDIPQKQKGGAGCIIRDEKGDLVVAAAYNLDHRYPHCNVAIVEAIALASGLRLAKTHNIRLDLIEGDNQEVINLVRGLGHQVTGRRRRQEPNVLSSILKEITEALWKQRALSPTLLIEQIPREENKVADKLATIGSKFESKEFNFCETYTTYEDLPEQVATLIREDKKTWM